MKSLFSLTLKKQRLDKNLTLREFARRTGYDVGNLSRVERGLSTPPPAVVVKKWAQVLGLEKGTEDYEDFLSEAALARQEIPSHMFNNQELLNTLPVLMRSEGSKKLTQEEFQCLVNTLKRNLT